MTTDARRRQNRKGSPDSTNGSTVHFAAAERAYHDAAATHGHDSAEALVAWWHWKESRRRSFGGRLTTVDRPDARAFGGVPAMEAKIPIVAGKRGFGPHETQCDSEAAQT